MAARRRSGDRLPRWERPCGQWWPWRSGWRGGAGEGAASSMDQTRLILSGDTFSKNKAFGGSGGNGGNGGGRGGDGTCRPSAGVGGSAAGGGGATSRRARRRRRDIRQRRRGDARGLLDHVRLERGGWRVRRYRRSRRRRHRWVWRQRDQPRRRRWRGDRRDGGADGGAEAAQGPRRRPAGAVPSSMAAGGSISSTAAAVVLVSNSAIGFTGGPQGASGGERGWQQGAGTEGPASAAGPGGCSSAGQANDAVGGNAGVSVQRRRPEKAERIFQFHLGYPHLLRQARILKPRP